MIRGYARVSTRRQAEEGFGLDAQVGALVAWGVEAEDVAVEEGVSAKDVRGRPVLEAVLAGLGPGDVLAVTKLDRLTRSLVDFAGIVADAQARGWRLVVLDGSFDLGSPAGRAMAGMMAVFAQFERELIGARTAEGIAERRAAGALPVRGAGRAGVAGLLGDVGDDVRAAWVAEYRACGVVSEVHRRLGGGRHRTTVARVLRAELGIARGPLSGALRA